MYDKPGLVAELPFHSSQSACKIHASRSRQPGHVASSRARNRSASLDADEYKSGRNTQYAPRSTSDPSPLTADHHELISGSPALLSPPALCVMNLMPCDTALPIDGLSK